MYASGMYLFSLPVIGWGAVKRERARAPNGLSMMMQRNIFTGPAINDNARDTG